LLMICILSLTQQLARAELVHRWCETGDLL
jgi:hypothetical protein